MHNLSATNKLQDGGTHFATLLTITSSSSSNSIITCARAPSSMRRTFPPATRAAAPLTSTTEDATALAVAENAWCKRGGRAHFALMRCGGGALHGPARERNTCCGGEVKESVQCAPARSAQLSCFFLLYYSPA